MWEVRLVGNRIEYSRHIRVGRKNTLRREHNAHVGLMFRGNPSTRPSERETRLVGPRWPCTTRFVKVIIVPPKRSRPCPYAIIGEHHQKLNARGPRRPRTLLLYTIIGFGFFTSAATGFYRTKTNSERKTNCGVMKTRRYYTRVLCI